MIDAYAAALDRIEDGETAVLLLEADGEVVAEIRAPVTDLPADGRHEGAVFDVRVDGNVLVEATYRPAATERRREAAQDRFDRLSRRLDDE